MQNLHKTNASWTALGYGYLTTVNHYLFGGASNSFANVGISAFIMDIGGLVDKIQLWCIDGSGSAALDHKSTGEVTNNAWNFWAISLDEAAGGTASTMQVNGTQDTFDGSYATPSTASMTYAFEVGGFGNGAGSGSGNRYGSLAFWEGRTLTAANLTTIHNATKERWGL
jgi:hypothetical protein